MARFLLALLLAILTVGPASGASQIPTDPQEAFVALCAVCHGEDGRGEVDNPAIDTVPMDFTDCAVTTPEPYGDWELVIARGGPAAGLSADMPSYGDVLEHDQIRALIGYVRAFCTDEGWPSAT